MRAFYLIATIIGAIIPVAFFVQFSSANPASAMEGFIPALFVNSATSGFTSDLLISSFVFWAFMFQRKNHGPQPWIFIALNLCIGLSCALPAYLYASEGKNNSVG